MREKEKERERAREREENDDGDDGYHRLVAYFRYTSRYSISQVR